MKRLIIMAVALFSFNSMALAASNKIVEMKTSEGDVTIELFEDKSPISTKNFLAYTNDKYYDGTVFHRVIKGFMIQGGGFTIKDKKLHPKETKAPIKNEATNGLSNKRGTLAMARTSDPDSATSQFFINHADNKALDYPNHGGGYAVFGKVTKGLDVLDKIANVTTGTMPHASGPSMGDVPTKEVKIISIKVVDASKESKESKESKAPKAATKG